MYRYAPTSTGWPSHYLHDYVAGSQIFEDQLLSLISNGVFNKFPDLKFVLLESGVTWLPGFIWRAVKTWRGVRAEVPWVNRSPAEIIRENEKFAPIPDLILLLDLDVESALARLGGVAVAGGAYRGVGIPACIASGRAAARSLL